MPNLIQRYTLNLYQKIWNVLLMVNANFPCYTKSSELKLIYFPSKVETTGQKYYKSDQILFKLKILNSVYYTEWVRQLSPAAISKKKFLAVIPISPNCTLRSYHHQGMKQSWSNLKQ